jgi:hypothetical protein
MWCQQQQWPSTTESTKQAEERPGIDSNSCYSQQAVM